MQRLLFIPITHLRYSPTLDHLLERLEREWKEDGEIPSNSRLHRCLLTFTDLERGPDSEGHATL